MKNRIAKALCVLLSLIVITLTLAAALPAFAQSAAIDFSAKGSVCITLKYRSKPISYAEFTVYKVADAVIKNDNLAFDYTDEFKGFSSNIDSLSESDSPKKLVRYVNSNGIIGVSSKTDKNGYVEFSDLDLGLYLVSQTKGVKGYSDCSSFLVYLPYCEDDVYKYEVDATPKTNIRPLTTKTTAATTTTTTTTTTKHNGFDIGDDSGKETYLDPNKSTSEDNSYVTDKYGNVIGTGDNDGNNSSSDDNKDDNLYKTGHNKVLIPVFAFCGIFIFSIGCILLYGGRKAND